MPDRIPVFVPPHLAQARKARAREYDERRGTSYRRGYGGKWWERTRLRIFQRDQYTCRSCGCVVGIKKGDAHCDHVVSKRDGGTNDDSNLQTLCVTCHSEKTRAGE